MKPRPFNAEFQGAYNLLHRRVNSLCRWLSAFSVPVQNGSRRMLPTGEIDVPEAVPRILVNKFGGEMVVFQGRKPGDAPVLLARLPVPGQGPGEVAMVVYWSAAPLASENRFDPTSHRIYDLNDPYAVSDLDTIFGPLKDGKRFALAMEPIRVYRRFSDERSDNMRPAVSFDPANFIKVAEVFLHDLEEARVLTCDVRSEGAKATDAPLQKWQHRNHPRVEVFHENSPSSQGDTLVGDVLVQAGVPYALRPEGWQPIPHQNSLAAREDFSRAAWEPSGALPPEWLSKKRSEEAASSYILSPDPDGPSVGSPTGGLS